MLCHAATHAMREGAFGHADDPLDEGGLHKLQRFRLDGPAPDRVVTSPARAARQTAEAFGIQASVEAALRDMEAGDWAGRSITDLLAADPDGLAAWMAEPAAGTPTGEPMEGVVDRVRPWLDGVAGTDATLLALSHPAVLRAAIAAALGMPVAATLAIDIAPLTAVRLSFHGRWRLQEIRAA